MQNSATILSVLFAHHTHTQCRRPTVSERAQASQPARPTVWARSWRWPRSPMKLARPIIYISRLESIAWPIIWAGRAKVSESALPPPKRYRAVTQHLGSGRQWQADRQAKAKQKVRKYTQVSVCARGPKSGARRRATMCAVAVALSPRS